MASLGMERAKRRPLASQAAVDDDQNDSNFETIAAAARLGRVGPPPFLHPRRLPVRTTIAAISLLVIGIVFSFSGLVVFLKSTLNDALPFLIIGVIGQMLLLLSRCTLNWHFQDLFLVHTIAGSYIKHTWEFKVSITVKCHRTTTNRQRLHTFGKVRSTYVR
jgi:hypothetical protein